MLDPLESDGTKYTSSIILFMGLFDQENTRPETVWFSVLAAISLICFPFGIWLGRRFRQILAGKLVVRPYINAVFYGSVTTAAAATASLLV